jgi:hypothetical protein
MDVCFDIPQEVLNQIPNTNETEQRLAVASTIGFDQIRKPLNPDEYTEVRISVEGSDNHCQKLARKMQINIQGHKFTSEGFEIVHCQS